MKDVVHITFWIFRHEGAIPAGHYVYQRGRCMGSVYSNRGIRETLQDTMINHLFPNEHIFARFPSDEQCPFERYGFTKP